jgi:hypothetical protein
LSNETTRELLLEHARSMLCEELVLFIADTRPFRATKVSTEKKEKKSHFFLALVACLRVTH